MNPARFLVLLLFFIFSLFVFTLPSFAQTPNNPSADGLHNYTQNVMIEVISALGCQVAGVDLVSPNQKCLGIANGKIGPIDSTGGAIGTMGGLIALTFTPPLSTVDYVNYLASNFGITKPSYAQEQGIGFAGLTPLTNVWIAFRNITYLLLVLIFLVIGFAIMLRVRIDPRTVMSIENQIPKIIVGLILVTFSFAIVGFLIDLMWVLIYLSMTVFNNIFEKLGPQYALSADFRNFHGLNALEAVNNINLGGGTGLFGTGQGKDGLVGITTNASAAVETVISGLFNNYFNLPVIGGIISTLAFIIIGIAILFALFRLWFQLIKAYVMILIVAVFSPFWIIAGLLPGSKLNFTNLLRELGSNLITFPATLIMFLLAKTFIDVFAGPEAQNIFVPPFIGNLGAAGEGAKAIGALTGLGIILLTPDVNKMMRKALQAPEFDFSAIGKGIGAGAGFLPSSFTRAGQIGYSVSGIRTLRDLAGGILGRRTAGGTAPPAGGVHP